MLASNTWLGMNELDEFYLQKLPYYLLFHNGQMSKDTKEWTK